MKLIFVFLLFPLSKGAVQKCDEVDKVKICTDDPNYNRMLPRNEEIPLKIGSSVTIHNIDKVAEDDQHITINILLAVFWFDSRLRLKNGNGSHIIGDNEEEGIFRPRMKIMNYKQIDEKKLIGPGSSDITFIYGFNGSHYQNHYFEYQQNFKVTLYCPFKFDDYPFEKNVCNFEYGPGRLFSDTVIMNHTILKFANQTKTFGEGPIRFEDNRLPFVFEFSVLDTFIHSEAGFNYSYSGVGINITRSDVQTLMIEFYLPTFIFAMLAQISYLINPEIVSFH